MLGRLAKAAYLFVLALMIVAYAASAANSNAPEPQLIQPGEVWYC